MDRIIGVLIEVAGPIMSVPKLAKSKIEEFVLSYAGNESPTNTCLIDGGSISRGDRISGI